MSSPSLNRRRFTLLAAAGAAVVAAPSLRAQGKPEKNKVSIAVGGKAAFYYLPLTISEQLGYFKAQGLDVEISDFAGGARALQALIGGSADVVTGSFDHTIQMQAKGQPVVGVVQLGRYPGYVLGVLATKAQAYGGPKDL